jgi:hypothetical protein
LHVAIAVSASGIATCTWTAAVGRAAQQAAELLGQDGVALGGEVHDVAVGAVGVDAGADHRAAGRANLARSAPIARVASPAPREIGAVSSTIAA